MSHAIFSRDIDAQVSTLSLVKNFEGWDSRFMATKHARRLALVAPEMEFFVVDDDDVVVWPQK